MSDNPITEVLSILRLFRRGPLTPGHSVLDHVRSWIGNDHHDSQVARVVAYGMDVAIAAEAIINNSELDPEAKQGLLQTTTALKNAFTLGGANNQMATYFPTLDSAITSFSILASATGLVSIADAPEIQELINDVDQMVERFSDPQLDPLVRETAQRHLKVLATMLRNVDAFGVDAAMAAYAEMVLRLQRTTKQSSSGTAETVAKLWPEVERWAGRLAVIDEARNHGGALLGHMGHALSLLPHLPHLPV